MSFINEVPGQRWAVEYLNYIGSVTEGGIRIGGHSKGGNLAVYAAAKCKPEIQSRIIRVYNNDGPGFTNDFLVSQEYLRVKDRVLKLVPQESVIGMLLGNDDNYTVVRSAKSGVIQHNCYLWEVKGRHFVRHGTLTKKTLELSRVLNQWISDKDFDTRRELTDAVYEILTSSDAKTLTDLARDRAALWRALTKVEPKKRDMVFRALTELLSEILRASVPLPAPKKRETEKTIPTPDENR